MSAVTSSLLVGAYAGQRLGKCCIFLSHIPYVYIAATSLGTFYCFNTWIGGTMRPRNAGRDRLCIQLIYRLLFRSSFSN